MRTQKIYDPLTLTMRKTVKNKRTDLDLVTQHTINKMYVRMLSLYSLVVTSGALHLFFSSLTFQLNLLKT